MRKPLQPLSTVAVEVLQQLFLRGPTWDGNVVSKTGRDDLVGLGLAERWNGWQWLTRDGVEVAVASGIEMERRNEWRRKANCQ